MHLQYTTDLEQRLFAVAYRMTGERFASQDLCQMAWERYYRLSEVRLAAIDNHTAYLCRIVINVSLDYLKHIQQQRETYPGVWLPEPIPTSEPNSDLDVPYGLTVLLMRLPPLERAVFLLREALDCPYKDIADWLGLTPEHCRQLYHRSAPKLQRAAAQPPPTATQQQALLAAFLEATQAGDLQPLLALLRHDLALHSDGGGKVVAARRVLHGIDTVATFMLGIYEKFGTNWSVDIRPMNNQWGICIYEGKILETIVLIALEGHAITDIYLVRNPDKLSLKTVF